MSSFHEAFYAKLHRFMTFFTSFFVFFFAFFSLLFAFNFLFLQLTFSFFLFQLSSSNTLCCFHMFAKYKTKLSRKLEGKVIKLIFPYPRGEGLDYLSGSKVYQKDNPNLAPSLSISLTFPYPESFHILNHTQANQKRGRKLNFKESFLPRSIMANIDHVVNLRIPKEKPCFLHNFVTFLT